MSSHFNELVESFIKSGATLGDAIQFARDQESHERQIRALEREETRKVQIEEAERVQRETELARKHEIEKERLANEKALREVEITEKLANEKALREAESARQLEMEREKLANERERIAMERLKQEAEIELRRIQLQNEQELNHKRLENQLVIAETENTTKRREIDARAAASTSSSSSIENETSHNFRKYELGVGRFDNVSTSLEPFIMRFEVVANAYNLPDELWSVELAKCNW